MYVHHVNTLKNWSIERTKKKNAGTPVKTRKTKLTVSAFFKHNCNCTVHLSQESPLLSASPKG
jgi:hypothetical protein